MQDLIARIAAELGADAARAEKALGIMLSLVKTAGNQAKVAELFAKLPGADELATKYGGEGFAQKPGLFGSLMGGSVAALAKLQGAGLTLQQVKQLGEITLSYAKEKAGEPLVRQAVGSIPGLSGYI
jgi:hypothetical protein